MAHAGLLLSRRGCEGPPELIGDEDRVVAEATGSVGALGDPTRADALLALRPPVGPRERNDATEARPSIAGTAQRVEEVVDARRVRRREARRAHAGGARERVDLETRVLCESGPPGG